MPKNLALFLAKMAKNLALSLRKWHKKIRFGENGGKRKINPSANPADVQGNEVADRLVKEAAKEAQELDQNTGVLTNQDIKKVAKDSIMDNWQDKWSISNTGREYFQYQPKILPNPRFDFPHHQSFILLLHSSQLKNTGKN